MTLTVTCQGCGEYFEARGAKAKWCSDRCRKAKAREAQESDPVETPSDEHHDHELVASVRKELEAVDRLDTFAGRLALQLAKRLADPSESGISSLSKELRTVMAAALDGVTPPSAEGDQPAAAVEVEDEVEKARRKREEARQAAGLA